jgi:TonB-linked SusC/RagA family outer membrane protein
MKKKMKICCSVLSGHRKTFKIMRVSLFLILISAFQVLAGASYSQTTRLSLSMKNSTVREVLGQIEDQSNFYFLYNNQLIDVERKVNVEVKNEKIEVILSKIFEAGTVNTLIRDRHIIITPAGGVSSMQQQKTVTGKVTEISGLGLPGVTVVVKGTQTGTVTNGEGDFSLSGIPANATLQFSFIGMKSQEVFVGNKTTLSIVLEVETFGVDEVVVTALGIRRSEKALGYAVQKVSGESLQKVSGVDVATSLTGKVAGLLVKNSTDFGVAPVLTIRGETPLLVIDGIAYANKTLSDISSEDIESMSVLKGGTASALYGFRGASGAILVTTKNGSTNKAGLNVDVASNTMFTAGFLAIPEKQSVYGRGTTGLYNINSDNSWGAKIDGSMQNQWDPFSKTFKVMPYLPVGKDNFANFLEQGYVTNNNVNVAYKGDIVSVRSSVNWTQNKGQYPNSTLDKYTYTFGGDVNLDKFKLSSNISYAKKESPNVGSNGYTSYDPMYVLLIWSSADFNVLDYMNNYWYTPGQQQSNHFGVQPDGTYKGANQNSPYYDRYEKTNEISRDIMNVDLSMSYDFSTWLKATVRSGVDFYKEVGQLRSSRGSYLSTGNTGVPGNPYTWNSGKTGGYNIGQSTGFSMNNDLLLTGNKSFNKINLEYLAGGTIFYKKDDNINANTVGGISIPGFFSIKASINPPGVNQSTYTQQVNSLFGRLGVSWNKLVYLEATGRNDWSSTLPKETQSYFYPSVAGSFVVSELLPSTKHWLDLLKVRSSWTMAKTPAGIYAINSSYKLNPGIWNDLNGASVPSSLYSPDVLPESANTFEAGVQGMAFKNRLMVDVSYYSKRMYDFLKYAPVTAASGYSSNYINIDEEITRNGWEVTVNGSPIKTKDWQLDLGLNWSTYERRYTKIDPIYSNVSLPWVAEGERVDVFYSKDFVRVPSTGELILSSAGRLQYSQYNSKFGYSDPDWLWGANVNLRYKAFSLFASLDGVVGGLMNTRTESYMWQSGVHPNSVTPEREKDVVAAGVSAAAGGGAAGTAAVAAAGLVSNNYLVQGVKVVSGTATYDKFGNITSDTRVYAPNDISTTYKQYAIDLHSSSAWGGNGSPADTYAKTFLKLREISLTYTVPNKYLHGWAKGASVSFVGQNVLLWAKDFKYSDPDGGAEDFSDPSVRYLGGNIKFTF